MTKFNYTSKVGLDFSQSIIATAVNQATRSIPTNLITDGGFDGDGSAWTLDNTFSISGGKLNVVNNSGGTDYAAQTITFPAAGTYVAEYDLVDYSAGTFSITYAAGTATLTADTITGLTATGKIRRRHYVTVAGTITIQVYANAGAVGSIDNFTCYNTNAATIGSDASTNLVTNGDFPTATTGWTKYETSGTGAISVVSAQLLVDNAGSATYTRAVQGITCTVGQAYELKCDLISTSNFALLTISTGSTGTSQIAGDRKTSAGTMRVNFVATATTMYVGLWAGDSVANTSTFDNVTCRTSNDILTNGEFGVDVSWTKGTAWTISGGVATITTPGATSYLSQTITLPVAGTYEFAVNCTAYTAGLGYITASSSTGTAIVTWETVTYITATGWNRRKLYVHSPGTLLIYLGGNSTASLSLDNFSCWLIEDDLSTSNDNGFQVHGQLRRVAVAPGADLRAFTGFSSTAYLEQPYTSALDFGTGNFTFSYWLKMSKPSTIESIFARSYNSGASWSGSIIYSYINASGYIYAYLSDDSGATADQINSGYSVADNLWHHVVIVRSSTTLYLYIDSTLITSGTITNAAASLSNTSATLQIGRNQRVGSEYPATNCTIVNFQVYNSALTAATIKTIYNREKLQFEAYAAYAELDAAAEIEIPIINSASQSNKDMRHLNESISQVREILFLSSKREWQLPTAPIPYASDSVTDLQQIRNFVDSVKKGQTFTFSERKGFDLFDDTRNVILDSIDHNYTRESNLVDYYRLNLKVREA